MPVTYEKSPGNMLYDENIECTCEIVIFTCEKVDFTCGILVRNAFI